MKKKNKMLWSICVCILILVGIIYAYLSNETTTQASATSKTTTTKEVEVSKQTITNHLTSSGEVISNVTETLELNTYRYFKEIYVEENDFVEEGANILKYTNGTYLVAPYNCVITKLSIPEESGDRCTSLHNIEIQSTNELAINISIEEEDIAKVKVGQEVSITINAYEDKTYTGTVKKINQIGTYASNGSSFSAVVTFANDGEVKIGMSGSCEITLEKAENVISIPIEAVQTKENEKYVVVKNEDGSTKNVIITTGISNDAYVEVTSGLTGNEIIEMTLQTTNQTNQKGMGMPMGEMPEGFEKINKERSNMPQMTQGQRGGM